MSKVKRYGYLGIIEEADGEVVKWEDYAALNEQGDALAAESAARGEIIERLIGQFSAAGYHAIQNSLNPAQSLLYDAMQVLKQPATNAYLNSVRAEGVEMVKSHPAITLCNLTHVCEEIANQLRAGKDGE